MATNTVWSALKQWITQIFALGSVRRNSKTSEPPKLPTTEKPFIAAYYVLKVLEEEGLKYQPSILLFLDGAASLILHPEDGKKFQVLAEQLMQSKMWYVDGYGNWCLASKEGLKTDSGGVIHEI